MVRTEDGAVTRKVIDLLALINAGRVDEASTLISELRQCQCRSEGMKELVDQAVGLAEQMTLSHEFVNALSNGSLQQDAPPGVPAIGPFKQLHANLRHLLWQLDRIASGDYSQNADFLGDFTSAYDSLVQALRQKRELEARLGESERLFRTVVTASPDEICMTELDGTIVFASEVGKRIFGLKETEPTLNRNIVEFIAPEEKERAVRNISAMMNGSLGTNEYQAVHPDGTKFWVEVNGHVMKDPEGRPERLLFVVRDVTYRKGLELELKRREERYRSLVEAAAIPIFILGPGTRIEFMNELGQQFLALGEEGPWYFRDFLDPAAVADLAQLLATAGESEVTSRDMLLVDSRGRSMWGHLSVRSIDFLGAPCVFVSCNDITDMKRTEEQLALANRKLTLLGSLTRHDVMNHLTALNGYLDLATMKAADPGVRRYLEKIAQSTAAIQRQMELTRTYQSVGAADAEWIEVRPAVERELAGMDLKKARVEMDLPDVEVFADPLFISCIHNLVQNSLKHGELVRQIRIAGREEGTGFILAVEDDGVGIPPTQKQAIFDWNYKGRSGHGLHFVREVLNSTGVRIREVGTAGHGARFEIIVPAGTYRMIKG